MSYESELLELMQAFQERDEEEREKLVKVMREAIRAERKADEQPIELLREVYVFVVTHPKEVSPWREAFGKWRAKVEKLYGWNDINEVEKYRQSHPV